MADILIKNMEMPKDNKRIFLCIEKDGEVGVFEEKKLIRFTEAQELPPYGRLIDADAIISKIERMVHPDDLTYTIAYGILKQIVEDAPTIVEASNGYNN